jgi:hypothetical protein
MVKRSEAGLAVAILVAVATSALLIQAGEAWSPAGSGRHLSGVALWLLAWQGLAVVTLILGNTMNVTANAAGGVMVLGISLGAVLKASGASDVVGASLGVTVCVVVMAAAAAGFQNAPRSRELVTAIVFWLLGECMLAGATWTCVFGE